MVMGHEKISAAKLDRSKQMLEFAYRMKANATDEQVKNLRSEFLYKFSAQLFSSYIHCIITIFSCFSISHLHITWSLKDTLIGI